jgi:peptidoglycan/LPS O-acetylase OafA/YrhL
LSAQNSLLDRFRIHFHSRGRDRIKDGIEDRAKDRIEDKVGNRAQDRAMDGMRSGKLDYIDALRGIAALSIFFYHIYGTTGLLTKWAYPIETLPERFVGLTLAGIPLFFIISAFTLYLSLDSKSGESRRFVKFYIRRLFRIAPLFYFLLIFVAISGLITERGLPSWTNLLANFTFTFNLIPQYSTSLFQGGWTVGVEMLFYLILPLIFLKVKSLGRSVLLFIGFYWLCQAIKPLLVAMIGESTMASTNYYYYNFFHWEYIFPLGIGCYLIYKNHLPRIKSEYRNSLALGMLTISLIILFLFIDNIPLSDKLFKLYEPLAGLTSLLSMSPIAVVLMLLSLSLAPNRFIVNRFTRFFGTISYSLYLTHPFIIEPLKPVYLYIYNHTIVSTDVSLFLCVLLTLLAAIPISLITYHLIETPGIIMGKTVMKRL